MHPKCYFITRKWNFAHDFIIQNQIIVHKIKSSRFDHSGAPSVLKMESELIDCMCVHFTVVTGSTDGIGKEYAKQLAQHGVNVVLIARNESKLIQVSREIGESIKTSLEEWRIKSDLKIINAMILIDQNTSVR